MQKDIYTAPEIAKICKVSRQTIFYWIKKGYLKAFRSAKNGVWRVTRTDLINYLKENNFPLEFIYGDRAKILIVDDVKNVARTLKRALMELDKFQVDTATSGFTAGTKLESMKPDVVVLDIFLEDMDGREFFEHIKSHPELCKTKVIGISGKLSDNDVELLLKKGFDTVLRKPFTLDQFEEAISNVLED